MKNILKIFAVGCFLVTLGSLFGLIDFETGGVMLSMMVLTPVQAQSGPLTRGGNGLQAAGPIAPGENLSLSAVVRSTKVAITSTAGAGAAETTVFLYNNDYLQNVTDNGSGANSIAFNFEDGFAGTLTSRKIQQANNAKGQVLYGGYLTCFADGVADETGLSNSEPFLLQYVGRGQNAIPTIIEVDDNFSRSDFSDGIGVFTCEQPFNESTQFQLNINGGNAGIDYAITVKLYFYPNFKI